VAAGLPASQLRTDFEINAASGTDVVFGTVAPAFGQAGGEVEAFLPAGTLEMYRPASN
jgi:hypothetical protein